MKYFAVLPLAGLAIAAPGAVWSDEDVTETATATVTGTYCAKSGMFTKPAPDNDVAKCTISVTKVTVTKATATVTVTETGKGGYGGPGKETVTVTVTETGSKPSGTAGHDYPTKGDKCLSDKKAEEIVNNFITLLEFTDFQVSPQFPGVPAGRGYKQDVSDATLDPKFVDISDSINLMAGFPLGSVTFPNKTAFDIGQGKLQPEVKAETLNLFHDCHSITWRWKVTPNQGPNAKPVNGINYFQVGDNGLVTKNYAEFNNAAWLESFGNPAIKCALQPITVKPGAPASRK